MPVARTILELRAQRLATTPTCALTLRQGDRERRYVIHGDVKIGWTVGEVWIGGGRHRRKRVVGVHDARALVAEFAREIADLVADGWTVEANR